MATELTSRTYGVMKGSGHGVEVTMDAYADDPKVVTVRYLEGPLKGKGRSVMLSSVRVTS